MPNAIYAVSTEHGTEGDCFYGTFTQWEDCFGDEVFTIEDLEFFAGCTFGDDVKVTLVEEEEG
jgi:hypothetical protein